MGSPSHESMQMGNIQDYSNTPTVIPPMSLSVQQSNVKRNTAMFFHVVAKHCFLGRKKHVFQALEKTSGNNKKEERIYSSD
jgi:hypothetical protein